MSVGLVVEAVGHATEFDFGYIFKIEHVAVVVGTDDDVAEFFGGCQTATVAHGVLEGLVALLAERTGCSLDVLLGKSAGDVGRHESVLGHDFGFEPNAHRVVGTKRHDVADTGDTLKHRHNVDFHVVVEEFLAVCAGSVDEGDTDKHRGLTFLSEDTDLIDFGGEEVGGLGYTVLDVDGRHVGVKALFESDGNGGRTGVCCGRCDVLHALGAVDRLFERSDDRVEHGLGVSAVVGRSNRNSRRRDVGILGNRQRNETDKTQKDDKNRNYRRKHRAVNKCIKLHCSNDDLIYEE